MYNYNMSKELKRIFAVFFIIFICIPPTGWTQTAFSGLGNATDPVPFMENARTGILPSGLRYYLLENSQPEGRAFLTLAVNAGSVLETEEERGLAHFVEHMAFNGTARFAKSELINYLRSLGMRFGPEINAYTSFDETVYGIEVPVENAPDGRKIIPAMALAVLDDWSHSVTFDSEDVNDERLVIMEEYRSRLGAQERINRQIYPVIFKDSPYADRLPIGLPAIIENAPAERLKGFYQKWYRPENMAVIIVGDFDSAYLERTLTEHFHNLWPESGSFNRPLYDLSAQKGGNFQTLVLTDSELPRSSIYLYWKQKTEKRKQDLADYRESVIDYLASIMLYLRFQEETAKSETPYIYGGAGWATYGYSSRFYALVAQAKTNSVKASLRELLLVKESLFRFGFTQSETDIAKAALISDMEQTVAEKDRQNSNNYVDAFTQHFLTGESVPDVEWELNAIEILLPGISLEEINERVKGYFLGDDLTVIISAPEAEKTILPTDTEVRAMAAAALITEISPPTEGDIRRELLEQTPDPVSVLSETTDSETGAIRWKLGNGAEIILKETKNKNSEISLYAQARGGTLSAIYETAVSAYLAAEMLNASGLGPYSRSELTRALLDKQVSLSFWTQNYLRGFQGGAAVKDLKTLFEMLYIMFTEPRFDPEAIKAMLDQRRTMMAYQENDPNAVFQREITRTINRNPRFHPLEKEELEKANIDQALAFIKACLNPGDYTFVFVGSLDIPLLRSLTETYLATIPASTPFNAWIGIEAGRPSDTVKEVKKGREEKSTVYMSWYSQRSYSDRKSAAVSVLNEYLDIRLIDEIREVLGGVYSVSSWVSLSPIPFGELSGGAYFTCDPKRVEELVSAVKEEFYKVSRGNIDDAVLQKAIEALIKEQEESIQSNLYIAQSYANSAVIYRSPLSRLDKRPALYRAVMAADLQKVAEELLSESSVRLTLYPEN
jgi:zinc protease